jgi:serine/threonine protein kinase
MSQRTAMPSATEYRYALLNLDQTITLSHLHQYEFVPNKRGTPTIYSGGFAMVCPVRHKRNGDKIAVRFFYYLPNDIQERYKAISAFINNNLNSGLFAKIEYHPQGVVINGKHYPICYMDWLEGDTLRRYVSNNLKDSAKIKHLAEEFRNMVVSLHKLQASHGDLNHENIMVVNGKMMLVDYDGMYVLALNGMRPCLIGDVNFQHPQRREEKEYFGPYQDDFSAIAIYISLLALQFDPSLYDRYENGGNSLLFRREDFVNPDNSPYFKELLQIPTVEPLAKEFMKICKLDIYKVPSFEAFINDISESRSGSLSTSSKTIFISHSTSDDAFVTKLAREFRTKGYKTFVDHENIKPSQDYDATIQNALDNSDVMVLVFSQKSSVSLNVKDEWNYFLEEQKVICPILLEDCERPFRLRRYQYVDFRTRLFDDAFEHLLEGLNMP